MVGGRPGYTSRSAPRSSGAAGRVAGPASLPPIIHTRVERVNRTPKRHGRSTRVGGQPMGESGARAADPSAWEARASTVHPRVGKPDQGMREAIESEPIAR